MLCFNKCCCGEIVNRSCDHKRVFSFISHGQIGQELFEMFKIDHQSMTAPEDQIWTWVEKNSVVNLEFDFRAQSLMQLQSLHVCNAMLQ